MLDMQQKSENSDFYRERQACCELDQGMLEPEGLHERVATWRMSAQISISFLAREAYMRRIERMKCRHRR